MFLASYYFDGAVNKIFLNSSYKVLDFFFNFVTNFAVVVAIMIIVPSIYFVKGKKINQIKILWVSFLISVFLSFILKLAFARHRPTLDYTEMFFYYSFPSLHAMASFSVLQVITDNYKSSKNFFIFFVVLVAFSRLYFTVHYLSDIVFGMVCGHFIGYYVSDMFNKNIQNET